MPESLADGHININISGDSETRENLVRYVRKRESFSFLAASSAGFSKRSDRRTSR